MVSKVRTIIPALVISTILGGCSVSSLVEEFTSQRVADFLLPSSVVLAGDDETHVDREVEVVYTDLGFAPASLEVDENTRVVFINKSGSRLWVASRQPFYSLQPRFSQGVSMGQDEWYSVVFLKPGKWTFINHLNPQLEGQVIVGQLPEEEEK